METNQPKWKCVGHVGDIDPIAHGGGFIYQDETGIYPPELAYFEPSDDGEWERLQEKTPLTIYRVSLEPPRFKTLTEEGKSRGLHHTRELPPSERGKTWEWYNEWFVDKLSDVATTNGVTPLRLLRELFSKEPQQRALAYWELILYFGPDEFDQYPLQTTEGEAYERYEMEMRLVRRG